jgi:threonine dehydrogenase-like Zn-dependent dehydrogenase
VADTVAIFRQGSMGLECLQIARISGAGRIITVDVREEACAVSRELGADHAFDAKACDPVAAIRDLTEGNGADVVFECAGGSPGKGWPGRGRSCNHSTRCARAGRSLGFPGSAARWR